MAKAGYACSTEAPVGLVAATAKTVLGVTAPAQFGVDLKGFVISFDGVTATAIPVLCEIILFTADGTGTTVTVDQRYGRTITAGFVAKRDYSIAPTGITGFAEFLLTPNGGHVGYDYPLSESPDCAVSNGFGIRCTAPAAANVRAALKFERC